MKNQLFEDLIGSIKELPTEILEEMRMNVNEEQMRKEFEAWAANHYWLREFGPERNLGNLDEYLDPEVQLAWEAFKASRESLVVELPKEQWLSTVEDVYNADEVKEALGSQGIKWK